MNTQNTQNQQNTDIIYNQLHIIILDYEEGGRTMYELAQNFIVTIDHHTYTVPKYFRTDLASIPRVFHMFIRPDGKYAKASVLHDFLLDIKYSDWGRHNPQVESYLKLSRKEIDTIFYKHMKQDGVNYFTRKILYYAVRFYAKFLSKFKD